MAVEAVVKDINSDPYSAGQQFSGFFDIIEGMHCLFVQTFSFV